MMSSPTTTRSATARWVICIPPVSRGSLSPDSVRCWASVADGRVRRRGRVAPGRAEARPGPPDLRSPRRPSATRSALEARERVRARVLRGVIEVGLDAHELVVLGDALRAGRRTGLDPVSY